MAPSRYAVEVLHARNNRFLLGFFFICELVLFFQEREHTMKSRCFSGCCVLSRRASSLRLLNIGASKGCLRAGGGAIRGARTVTSPPERSRNGTTGVGGERGGEEEGEEVLWAERKPKMMRIGSCTYQ